MELKKRIPWNKGLKIGCLSEEHKKKISEKLKGKVPKNFKNFQKKAWKSNKGKIPWNKGLSLPKGKRHPNWKGDMASYDAIHTWVRKNKDKPNSCPKCGKKGKLELSNISEEYKRNIEDYEWLCCRCHRTKDGWFEKVSEKIERDIKGKFRKKNIKDKLKFKDYR